MNFRYSVLLLIFIAVLFSSITKAQTVTGKILNEQNEPIPYATIFVHETKEGTISNTDGDFKLQLNRGTYNLTIRSLGFIQIEKEVVLNSDSIHFNITLKNQEYQIKEVKIFPGDEDPAYFIMRKAIAKAPFYRQNIKHYEADLYIKSNFEFTNIPKIYQNKVEINGKKMKHYFKENVTYVIESHNKITYDYPNKYDQKVINKKSSLVGFDEPPVMQLMTSSFYEERTNQVISPLSSLALKHYKFRYEGFITVGNFDVFKIKVTPKRKSDELVEGYIYIVDKLWCMYNLDFSSTMEFFKYRIKQQFENLGNGNWLPISININGSLSMLGLRANFYYGTSVKYSAIEDNNLLYNQILTTTETGTDTIISRKTGEKEIALRKKLKQITDKEEYTNRDVKKASRLNRKILKEQYKDSTIAAPNYGDYKVEDKKDSLKNDISWDTIRAIPLTPAEIESYTIADSLITLDEMETDSITGEKKKKEKSMFSKIVFGHYDLAKDSLVWLRYDGLLSIENYGWNTVDGFKYKQKLQWRINPDSAKYIYITPEIGYAFNRKAVYGSFTGRFRNIIGYGNTFGFAIGKESRDFKPAPLGIDPGLNAISSWFFAENYMKLYETEFLKLNISQRFKKDFALFSTVEYNQFFKLKNNTSYVINDKREYSPNIPKGFTEESPELQQQKSFVYTIGLSYYKRNRKPWLQESPFLFMSDFYRFNLNFKQGVKNVLASGSSFSQIDFRFHQQANISPSAGIEWKVNAGYFFNNKQMHFSQFKHFNTSEILVPFKQFSHTFQMLNDYEFSTNNSYLNVATEFRSEYLLLRYLSFINRKTWSESIHLNYLTTPNLKNYWEAGYSLNSLFFVGNIGVFTGFKGGEFESVSVKVSISGFD